jgi:hypothetical protein
MMIVTMMMMMMMIMAPNVAVEWVTLLLRVQEVHGFKLRYGERYPDLGFHDFSQASSGTVPQIWLCALPSQLIIY